jgi:hypothetical protein
MTQGSVRDSADLKKWVYSVLQGDRLVPTWESEDDRAEWNRFLQRFDHREHSIWRRLEFDLPVRWYGQPRKAGTRVRVSFKKGDAKAAVLGVSLDLLGETSVPNVTTTHFFGIVGSDQTSLRVSFFGA